MALRKRITRRASTTEPLTIRVGVGGVDNLDDVDEAFLYLREEDNDENEVDGAEITVSDSEAKEFEFDPAGNGPEGEDALKTPGTYRGYVKIKWTDADETEHPDDAEMLVVEVLPSFE